MMIKFLLNDLKESDKAIFVDMVPYIFEKIKNVKKNDDFIEIECDDEDVPIIHGKLEELKEMVTTSNDGNITTKVIKEYPASAPVYQGDVFGQLEEKGCIKELATGAFSYSGIYLDIYRYFERKISEYAFECFPDIKEQVFPVLFPVKEYHKGRYFENFPHYMMFQTKLNNSVETYGKFMSRSNAHCDCSDIHMDTSNPQNVLRHAACAPVYPMLQDKTLSKTEAFFVSGRCFRNEESNVETLSRLNEFLMMEYVFVGKEESLLKNIEKAEKLTQFWFDEFGLQGKIETANDSFFASNYKKLKYFQLIGNSKLEYKIFVPESKKYISTCSANFHRSHFSKPYNIRNQDGNLCYTACYAFGIDRLAFALLSQKGLDVNQWDRKTFNEINKYVSIK